MKHVIEMLSMLFYAIVDNPLVCAVRFGLAVPAALIDLGALQSVYGYHGVQPF